MNDKFVPLGLQSPEQIAAKLEEFEEDKLEAAELGLESANRRAWLNTQHQYGFIPRFIPGEKRYHPIKSASNMAADDGLKGKRLNIRLDYLRVYQYPGSIFPWVDNVHTILFSFEARNQVENGKEEAVAFNQQYRARSGHDASVLGQPIFVGLTVGANGVGFTCRTVNVSNSADEELVTILNADSVTAGLNLLTTAQPALAPLTSMARGLAVTLAGNRKNVPVQEVHLGLDFETGALGARLAVGSYIVAQTPKPDAISWDEWVYDAEIGTVMSHPAGLAQGEKPYPLPYNAFVFRVSPYVE